jgi:hypothetical protein
MRILGAGDMSVTKIMPKTKRLGFYASAPSNPLMLGLHPTEKCNTG